MKHKHNSDIWMIIPVKQWSQSKMRLSSHFSGVQREALSRAMLYDCIERLKKSHHIKHILLVTHEPSIVELSMQLSVSYLIENKGVNGYDLNAAMQQGFDYASSNGADFICCMHADIPWFNINTIDQELSQCLLRDNRQHLSLFCDRKAQGSNVLILDSGCRFKFVFGQHSRINFQQQARSHHYTMRVKYTPGLGDDIDTIDDLQQLEKKIARAQIRNREYPQYTSQWLNTIFELLSDLRLINCYGNKEELSELAKAKRFIA